MPTAVRLRCVVMVEGVWPDMLSLTVLLPALLTFETLAGVIKAEIMGERVKLELPLPYNLTCDYKIELDGKDYLLTVLPLVFLMRLFLLKTCPTPR